MRGGCGGCGALRRWWREEFAEQGEAPGPLVAFLDLTNHICTMHYRVQKLTTSGSALLGALATVEAVLVDVFAKVGGTVVVVVTLTC